MAYPITLKQGNLTVSYRGEYIHVELRSQWTSKWIYECLPDNICKKCSNPLITEEQKISGICGFCNNTYGFDRAYAMGFYEHGGYNKISDHILKFKEGYNKFFGKTLAFGLSLMIFHRYPELLDSDVIIPVPMGKEKLSQSGFNHAEYIANIVSIVISQIATNLPIEKNMMVCKEEFEQRGKNSRERFEQVVGKFAVTDRVNYSKVLIIDDVLTTGATVSECAKILKDGGANEVNVLVAGRNKYEG